METAGTIVSISCGALLLLLAMPTLVLYALGAALMPLALVVVGAQALCRAIYRVGSATTRRAELLPQDQGAPLSPGPAAPLSAGSAGRCIHGLVYSDCDDCEGFWTPEGDRL